MSNKQTEKLQAILDGLQEESKNLPKEVQEDMLRSTKLTDEVEEKYEKELFRLTRTAFTLFKLAKPETDADLISTLKAMNTFAFMRGYLQALRAIGKEV